MWLRISLFGMCVPLLLSASYAQTTVTTSGGTSNTVPKFSGNATLINSVITESNGNVGIGITTPGYKLDVVGNNVRFGGNGSGTDYGIILAPGGTDSWKWVAGVQGKGLQFGIGPSIGTNAIMTMADNGNFGIGTTNPQDKLHVHGDIGLAYAASIKMGQESSGVWSTPQFNLITSGWENNADFVKFWVPGNNGATSPLLTLRQGGNVGIGTTTPAAKLDVNGNVKISGVGSSLTFADGSTQSTAWTGSLCGGDYAESVDVSGDHVSYEAGDVLVLSSGDTSDVSKSSEPYSTLVAGIYSTRPGLVGKRSSDHDKIKNQIPMAMVGIVPTKVTAENGPIKKGDLLVSSSTAGYAMKGTDRSRMLGAVIGKAMGSLQTGSGVVEVLVSLQ